MQTAAAFRTGRRGVTAQRLAHALLAGDDREALCHAAAGIGHRLTAVRPSNGRAARDDG